MEESTIFENRYERIRCIGAGMKGITYLVHDKYENRDVVAKFTIYDDAIKGLYYIIHSINIISFVKPLNWYQTDIYPEGYDKPPIGEESEQGWIIYTMPFYHNLDIDNYKPDHFKRILFEYKMLQKKFGFCQGGDIGGNLMFGKLNDGSGDGIIVIDLDDSYFTEDEDVQYQDSCCLIDAFRFANNSQEFNTMLDELEKVHSTDWKL